MTLRWIEGFETHQVEAQILAKYDAAESVYQGAETFPTGRVFGSAISAEQGANFILRTPNLGAAARWTCGLAYRSTGSIYTGDDWWLFKLIDSVAAAQQCSLWIIDGSTSGYHALQVRIDNVIVGVSDEFPASGDWQYVEWQVLLSTSVGTIEVRLNKVVVISLTGLNTAPTGNEDADTVEFGGGATGGIAFDIDDVYILDGAKVVGLSSPHTDFLGPVVVKGMFPVADALPNDMTPDSEPVGSHFDEVDDLPTQAVPENTFNEGTGGVQEFYDFGSAAEIEGGVLGVQLDFISLLDLAGSETLTAYHKRKRRGPVQDAAQDIGSDTIDAITILGSALVIQADPFNGERLSIEDVEHGTFGVEAV